MSFTKNARILATGLGLQWKKLLEYRLNLAFDLLLRLADSVTFFLFWAVILASSNGFAGWGLKEFLIVFALESYFTALVVSFAYAGLYTFERIHKAELDAFLTKPAQPWLLSVVKGLDPSFAGLISGTAALALAFSQGISMQPLALGLGFLMIVLGVAITALFGLSLATASFWLGRMDSLESVFESFWSFSGKPASIFPIGLQVLTAFTFPFIFVQTVPTLAILEKIQVQEMMWFVLAELAILAVWAFVFKVLWNKGLRNYESGGG